MSGPSTGEAGSIGRMTEAGELAFVATMRDEASTAARGVRSTFDKVGGPTKPITTDVRVDADQALRLLDELPRNTRGTVSQTTAEFRKLGPGMRAAVLDAQAEAKTAAAGIAPVIEREVDQIVPALKASGEEGGRGLVAGITGGLSGAKGAILGGDRCSRDRGRARRGYGDRGV